MCSPAGFNRPDEKVLDAWLERMMDKKGIPEGWVTRGCGKGIWKFGLEIIHKHKLSPWSFLVGFKDRVLEKWLGQEGFNLSEVEQKAWVRVYHDQLELRTSGEKFLGYFLQYASYSDHPWGELLPALMDSGVKFEFFYGDRDWMDLVSVRNEIETNFAVQHKFVPIIIQDCGHQMVFENPDDLSAHILGSYFMMEQDNVDRSYY